MLSLVYSNINQRGDLVRTGSANLDTDEGLQTAVTISLLSDARAQEADDIDPNADKRGWWGETFLDSPSEVGLGSRLWLLTRGKMTRESLLLSATYAREALQWMIDDRIASDVQATAERLAGRNDVGILTIKILRPRKTAPRFEGKWEVQFAL